MKWKLNVETKTPKKWDRKQKKYAGKLIIKQISLQMSGWSKYQTSDSTMHLYMKQNISF